MGDNSSPYPYVMELWDTVTNIVSSVPHPPGYHDKRFFKPTMATYDDTSIIVASGEVVNATSDYLMEEMWQYKFNVGWINLGQALPPHEANSQYDIYMLDNTDLEAYNSLARCVGNVDYEIHESLYAGNDGNIYDAVNWTYIELKNVSELVVGHDGR